MTATVRRLLQGIEVAALGGSCILLIGLADHFTSWPMLTSTLGPTAYLLLAHPDQEASRFRNAAAGHGTAIAAGLGGLCLTGSWSVASSFLYQSATLRHVLAAAIAVAITLFVLGASDLHHAPAGSTAVFVATGLAGPGKLLAGLAMGLIALFILVRVIDTLPGRHRPGRFGHQGAIVETAGLVVGATQEGR